MNDLAALVEHIERVWVCDSGRYPDLAGLTPEQRLRFVTGHSLLHIQKTGGKIAGVLESYDHEGCFESEETFDELKVLATKMFLNAVNLAREVGLTAEELLKNAPSHL